MKHLDTIVFATCVSETISQMKAADRMQMTSLKEDLAKMKAGEPIEKPRMGKKKARRTNGKAIRKVGVSAEMFAHALIQNEMNATKAYLEIKPNVTDKTAATEGMKYLRKPETIAALTPLLEKLFLQAGVTTEYVFRRWTEIATASAADYFNFESGCPVLDMSDMTPAQRANLKSISINHTQYGTNYRIETYDAQKAIEHMGRHLGLLVDKMDAEDVERIGDLIEQGVNRIRETKDLDGWRDVILNVELTEVR